MGKIENYLKWVRQNVGKIEHLKPWHMADGYENQFWELLDYWIKLNSNAHPYDPAVSLFGILATQMGAVLWIEE